MKTFLKITGVIIALIIATMLILGKDYHYEKSIVINATKEKVWQNVNSMKGFNTWNPWSDLDPNFKVIYSGNSGALGDQYCWDGNEEAGKGCHVITAIVPDNKVSSKMMFEKPFQSEAISDLILTPQGNSTKVTWTMDCELDYPINLMKLFMDGQMDDSYSKGLAKLKALSEK